jgi:hypothetical protein
MLAEELVLSGRPFAWEGCVTTIGQAFELATLQYLAKAQKNEISVFDVNEMRKLLASTQESIQVALEVNQRKLNKPGGFQRNKKQRQQIVVGLQQQARDLSADGTRFNIALEEFLASPARYALDRIVAETKRREAEVALQGVLEEEEQAEQDQLSFEELLKQMKLEAAGHSKQASSQ